MQGDLFLQIGGLSVFWHGVIISLSAVFGFSLSYWLWTGAIPVPTKPEFRKKSNINVFLAAIISAAVSGLLFGRFFYCYGAQSLHEFFRFTGGGTALPGAILGGILGIYIFCGFTKTNIGKILDIAAPGAALAISLGRLAALSTGENLGEMVEDSSLWRFPYAMYIKREGIWRQPMFIFESLLALSVLAALLFVISKKRRDRLFNPKSGDICILFLILYFVPQGVFEMLRYDRLLWNTLGVSRVQTTSKLALLTIRTVMRLQTVSLSASVSMIAAAAAISILLIRRIKIEKLRPRTLWQIPVCAVLCFFYFHGVLRMTLPGPLTEYQYVWIGAIGLIFVGVHTLIQTSFRPVPFEKNPDEPVRVLHVVGRMDRGGIETMIMNIYRSIDLRRVQFDFLAHYGKENADYNEEIKSMGGRIYEIPIKTITDAGNVTHYHKFFTYRRELKRFFLEHQEYDAVHGHMTNTAAIYMPIAKRYGRVKCLIAHSHSVQAVRGLQKFVSDILHLPVRFLATDLFSCSESASSWLFGKSSGVKIIHNGIDTKKFAFHPAVREEVRRHEGLSGLVIGVVARFQYPKNQAFLLQVLKSLLVVRGDITLCFVGDGQQRREVEQLAAEMGLSGHIRFMGLRSDINLLEQAFDLFALPSFYEGQPVTLIEAQCAGLPCLVSDGISIDSDVTGKVRFLPLSAGGEAWAKAALELAEIPREDGSKQVRDAGYDSADTAKILQEFYLVNNE